MTLIAVIATWSLLAFGMLLFLAQFATHEFGFWLGRRHAGQGQGDGVGIVVGAMLGLLAFVLALTLSFSNTRFSERRAGALEEANAIGTAWLRAEAIGQPRGFEIARLLEEYGKIRVDFVRGDGDAAAIDDLNKRTNALQTTIWGHVSAIVREQPTPVTAALMSALNDTFDMTTTERFAYDFHLPPQIFWLLTGMSLLGMGALGYQLGIKGKPVRIMAGLLMVTWTVVIVNIFDLASPRVGSFRTSTSVYEWTLEGFQGGMPIPPVPAAR